MPNRVVREGLLDSEQVNNLSDSAFRFFTHLLLAADDAGRMDGRIDILRARCFPVGSRRASDVQKLLEETVAQNLVRPYSVRGKPYVQVMKWRKTTKTATSKFPSDSGSFGIEWVTLDTRDGEAEFVTTSLGVANPMPIPSAPHADGIGTPSAPHADGVPMGSRPIRTETETKPKSESGGSPARAANPKRQPTDDHSVLVRHFCSAWSVRHQGTKYAFDGAKDGKAVQWLLDNAGTLAEAKRVVDAYLADPDPWLATKGHSLSFLRSQFNAVRGRLSAPAQAASDNGFVRAPIDEAELAEMFAQIKPPADAGTEQT